MSPPPKPSTLPDNRSIPPSTVIPVLTYPDVREAVDWLCSNFGFRERLQIGTHRSQLSVGEGSVVVAEQGPGSPTGGSRPARASVDRVMVRLPDVASHHERARQAGVQIINPPTDHPYGERQYTAADFIGRHWTFSQTIADVDPADWGGILVDSTTRPNGAATDLYNNAYSDFASTTEAAVRQATYGEDIGQSSWLTAQEWLEFADRLAVGAGSKVLEVGSGSGGPAVYLAIQRGCQVTGVDINEHGVKNARALADARGVGTRATFEVVDAGQPLPFPAESFDAIVSNDAMCHIDDRLSVLREWYRVLRSGGRLLYSDALIVTGPVSHEELATRSSIGFYLFLPPGENERLLREAGFDLVEVYDATDNAALLAGRWHDARAVHREQLVAREGETNFEGLQRFLDCVHRVSSERRLSRYVYVAEKPQRSRPA
jgi:SAM-dependent methyltransferase/uncharacterized glyoxalase superfamily protein PhnB